MDLQTTLELLLRLLAALVCGSLIGLERRFHAQPAGLRTQMLICVGACLATLASVHYPMPDHRGDSGRIAAAVLTGIGFIGGGAILRTGVAVHGLTTAASIWISAAIGISLGVGHYVLALPLTAIVLGGLNLLDRVEEGLTARRSLRLLVAQSDPGTPVVEALRPALLRHGLKIEQAGMSCDAVRAEVRLLVSCPERIDVEHLMKDLLGIPGIRSLRLE